MLELDPTKRLSADEVLQNPGVKKNVVNLPIGPAYGKKSSIQKGELSGIPGSPLILFPKENGFPLVFPVINGERSDVNLKEVYKKTQFLQVMNNVSLEEIKVVNERRPSDTSIVSITKLPPKIFRSFTPGLAEDREIPKFNPFPEGNVMQQKGKKDFAFDEDEIPEEIGVKNTSLYKYFLVVCDLSIANISQTMFRRKLNILQGKCLDDKKLDENIHILLFKIV